MPASTTRESIGSHLHHQSNTRIHLLPRKSIIHCHIQTASNVQCYNPTPLFLSANNYRIIILWCTPNVHLIPFGNANDQRKYIPDLLFSSAQSLEKFSHPFYAITHLPSSPTSSILGDRSLGKASSHRKFKQARHILTSNHHTDHIMLMEINGHYWVLVSQNGLSLVEVLYQHTVACSNSFFPGC